MPVSKDRRLQPFGQPTQRHREAPTRRPSDRSSSQRTPVGSRSGELPTSALRRQDARIAGLGAPAALAVVRFGGCPGPAMARPSLAGRSECRPKELRCLAPRCRSLRVRRLSSSPKSKLPRPWFRPVAVAVVAPPIALPPADAEVEALFANFVDVRARPSRRVRRAFRRGRRHELRRGARRSAASTTSSSVSRNGGGCSSTGSAGDPWATAPLPAAAHREDRVARRPGSRAARECRYGLVRRDGR